MLCEEYERSMPKKGEEFVRHDSIVMVELKFL
jgi:hypothetical protein